MNAHWVPTGMNIELTTCCPLNCPQCYCSLLGGRHIALETAQKALVEGRRLGIEHVELSGGETLCYPHLHDVIVTARQLGIAPNISISGWHFDDVCLSTLIEDGIEGIHVSLNGPTEESNALSRDGFEMAISALDLLKRRKFSRTRINWVMHRDTSNLLEKMITLAQTYQVKTIVIMMPKPTASNELLTFPLREQIEHVANLVKHNSSSVELSVETCFSQILALIGQNRFWGNLNCGEELGCTAGRSSLNVSVDGRYSPCRHLDCYEDFDTMEEYWIRSVILQEIRNLESNRQEPCKNCSFCNYCRHCLAYNFKVKGKLLIGNENCTVYQTISD